MSCLCVLFGVSRQSYYQRHELDFERLVFRGFVIDYVREVRLQAPRMGYQKLFEMCKNYFGDKFTMGRDAFYHLLGENGLMLRMRRHKARTTHSDPSDTFYPNLIKGLTVTAANQVWVCDITYVWTESGFCYLFLVTDLYSHRIMGWLLSTELKHKNAQEVLQQAIETADCPLSGLIHHSDRGVQYTSSDYMNLLGQYGIQASRTEHGDPLENAVAERVNGILKQEWLSLYTFDNLESVRKVLAPAIEFYNKQRPHASNDWLTPEQAYNRQGVLKKRWMNYYPPHKGQTPVPE